MAEPLKYNKNIDLVKGESNLLFIAGLPVAYAKKDDFKFSPSTIDVASKFSGKYADKMGGKNEWSLSVEAFVSKTSGHMSYEALENIAASGKAVPFEICAVTLVDENGVRSITKGAVFRKGRVTVSDLSKASSAGEYETCTCTLNGSGPLLNAEGNEIGSTEALTAAGATIS